MRTWEQHLEYQLEVFFLKMTIIGMDLEYEHNERRKKRQRCMKKKVVGNTFCSNTRFNEGMGKMRVEIA